MTKKGNNKVTTRTDYLSLFIGINLLITSIVGYIFELYFFVLIAIIIACGKIIVDAIYSKKINDYLMTLLK